MRTTSGNGATLRLHYRPGWLLFYRHKEDSRLGAQCTIGGRASETECALPLTVFPHARTQERARVCTCATPLTCNTRPRMHTKATQTVTNACSPCTWWGRVQASFGPENLPTFLVARANECTSVRRNFGGCTPILVGWTRTENLNLVQGSSARFAARMEARRSYVQPFSRRGWRRGRR